MKNKKYIKSLLSRILISIILFLIVAILINKSDKFLLMYNEKVYNDSLNFSKISNLYNKVFGKVLPLDENAIVVNKQMNYSSFNAYLDGAVLNDVSVVYPFKSGIVVFIGEKENYGNTIIIEGMDQIDYWYSNVDNINVKLYDYVKSDDIIAESSSGKIYVLFKKDGKNLNYEDYL